MDYVAPLKDMLFVLNELAGLPVIQALPDCEEATPEMVCAVLEENARFCEEVIAPLNQEGDRHPARWHDGQVRTAPGFKEAFAAFSAASWQGLPHPVEFGGQGLPKLVATPCMEMLNAACLSFALCPLLTDGAIEALLVAGSDVQKESYLPNLIAGKWTGTMNLTEPQAGSDLALVRTRAQPHEDGTWRIFGTKIFITYGEHDMAENIVHLVLARLPDAPEGVKGLSLFLVPKWLPNKDGAYVVRNDVVCTSIEHKLGIKASPTAVLQFGDDKGAVGVLLGGENDGLKTMFIMMNAARFAVGVQGVALAERTFQKAVRYARERVQSKDLDGSEKAAPIIRQPDVRRMLMSMKSQIEAARALTYVAAAYFDTAQHHPDADVRVLNRAAYELMVPVIKGWATEVAVEVTSAGLQIHGGMGFIEETGVAQFYRDARILTIYEGTTAIQANDLVARKTVRDEGKTMRAILEQVRQVQSQLAAQDVSDMTIIAAHLGSAADALEAVVDYVLLHVEDAVKEVFAGSVPYLKLTGIVLGGWQMARAALRAREMCKDNLGDTAFLQAKITTTRFFAEHSLSQAQTMCKIITQGGASVMALDDAQF